MNFFNMMLGRVKISIEGFFIEKFINICTYRKIKLNNVRRLNGCILETEVSIKDFRKLRQICKKTKCRLKILDKKGIPFVLHRYRKRKLVIFAVFIIIVSIIYANCLIWQINVNCDNPIISDKVSIYLQEAGIEKYTYKYKWDMDYLKNDIMINIKEITWIEMEIKGVALNIDLKVGELPPTIINENEYCNVIATKTGVIDRIIVKNGLKTVEVGDIVEKGDVLISGLITSEYVDDWFLHADGEIYAKVWYAKKIQVPLKENKFIYTGNKEIFYGTKLINKKVFFGKVSTNYKEYDTMLKEKNLNMFNINLPIKFYEYTYYEKQTQNIDRTYEEALEYGSSILEEMILSEIPKDSKVLDTINNNIMVDNDVQIELIYECLEQIGTKEKIS